MIIIQLFEYIANFLDSLDNKYTPRTSKTAENGGNTNGDDGVEMSQFENNKDVYIRIEKEKYEELNELLERTLKELHECKITNQHLETVIDIKNDMLRQKEIELQKVLHSLKKHIDA